MSREQGSLTIQIRSGGRLRYSRRLKRRIHCCVRRAKGRTTPKGGHTDGD
jgi:hypothetical protein